MQNRSFSKIYILSIANFASGGPELLHQLAYSLRLMGLNAYMYYVRNQGVSNDYDPVPENYKIYNIPYVFDVNDSNENLLVIPEISLKFIPLFHDINCVIWWLSVDNAYVQFDLINEFYNRNNLISRFFCKLVSIMKVVPPFDRLYFKYSYFRLKWWINTYAKKPRVKHWAQSYYALNFLKILGVDEINYLSDYLRSDYLKLSSEVDLSKKQNIVVYNPKKGVKFTQKIIAAAGSQVVFIPIKDMSILEVTDLLLRAKVYIDFGEHPGKDRIPREAAVLGCCVITGKRGSAAYFEDVPIPEQYKFNQDKSNISEIISIILKCFEHFEYNYSNFSLYRKQILNEHNLFVNSLKKLFVEADDEGINSYSCI